MNPIQALCCRFAVLPSNNCGVAVFPDAPMFMSSSASRCSAGKVDHAEACYDCTVLVNFQERFRDLPLYDAGPFKGPRPFREKYGTEAYFLTFARSSGAGPKVSPRFWSSILGIIVLKL